LQEQIESQGIEKDFAKEVLDRFAVHDWPGNVRELRNTVIHGYLLAGEEITIDDLPEHLPNAGSQESRAIKTQIGMTLAAVERRHLLATLAHFGGDKKQTAETLGISLKTLYNRLKRYNVS
jgi:DNA-binding NtrC family response regulator